MECGQGRPVQRNRQQNPQRSQQRTSPQRQNPQPRRSRPRRKRQRYTLHYLILFLFCIALGAVLCTNVLFKVSSIQVKNCTYYGSEELISRSGIQKGDKLFSINTGDTEAMLEDRFPYLKNVEIKRRLPSTVVIEVVEETPMGAAYTDEGFAILSSTGKVLKNKVSKAPGDIPVLLGLEEERYTVGSYLYEQNTQGGQRVINEKLQLVQRFLDEADAQALEPLTYIQITDLDEIKVLYDERILMDFGSELDLAKKITFVQKVLDEGIAENHPLSGYTNENFEGTIDITDRKQLRTRAIAISTIVDERAFVVFEEDSAFFAEDDEASAEDSTFIGEEGSVGADEETSSSQTADTEKTEE
ncbi:MAG: FtsQ-type POTRA domain-containing protein [Oscillospiraceae bacterium]|nr:FtsQ-type POTRA domain-containing protein [Oscillospiraceae bacterium]